MKLAALLIAIAQVAGALPAAAAAPATTDTLTVVTLNLWHDQREWPKRLNRIVGELRWRRPDVICLQEVLQHEKLPNQAQALAESLGYHVRFGSVDPPTSPKRYGNAVLTPHPIVADGVRNLEPVDDYRVVVHARIDWRGRKIDAYSTHLHHTREGGAIRTKQITHLLAYIDSTHGQGPLVLAGDFNAEPGTPEMQPLRKHYANAFRVLHPSASRDEAATFNPRFGVDPGAIDHIFVGTGMMPIASEILFRSVGPDSVWASDHFGVMAKVAVPPKHVPRLIDPPPAKPTRGSSGRSGAH